MSKLFLVLSVFLSLSQCTVLVHWKKIFFLIFEVLSPPSIQGEYLDAQLSTMPTIFNITGSVVKADPFHGCTDYVNYNEVAGNIVLVLDGTTKEFFTLTKKIQHVFGTKKSKRLGDTKQKVYHSKDRFGSFFVGFLLLSVGTGVPVLGYHYSVPLCNLADNLRLGTKSARTIRYSIAQFCQS